MFVYKLVYKVINYEEIKLMGMKRIIPHSSHYKDNERPHIHLARCGNRSVVNASIKPGKDSLTSCITFITALRIRRMNQQFIPIECG